MSKLKRNSKIVSLLIPLIFFFGCSDVYQDFYSVMGTKSLSIEQQEKSILSGQIRIGMTTQDLFGLWGAPLETYTVRDGESFIEIWTYGTGRYGPPTDFCFVNNLLVTIHR